MNFVQLFQDSVDQSRPNLLALLLNTLILFACDQVGTISSISRLLSKNNINIAFLSVERAARGGEVMMSIEIDNELSQDLLAQIIDLDWVHWVRLLPRVEV